MGNAMGTTLEGYRPSWLRRQRQCEPVSQAVQTAVAAAPASTPVQVTIPHSDNEFAFPQGLTVDGCLHALDHLEQEMDEQLGSWRTPHLED